MKLGNIEEFFNKNFFKKTRRAGADSQFTQSKDQFGGVPESHYEPTAWQDNLSHRHGISEDFHPGSLSGFTSHLETSETPTEEAQGEKILTNF